MESLLLPPYINPIVAIPQASTITVSTPALSDRVESARAASARVAAAAVVGNDDDSRVLSSALSAVVAFPHSGATSSSSWMRHPAEGVG